MENLPHNFRDMASRHGYDWIPDCEQPAGWMMKVEARPDA
jgi:hypothetical protein